MEFQPPMPGGADDATQREMLYISYDDDVLVSPEMLHSLIEPWDDRALVEGGIEFAEAYNAMGEWEFMDVQRDKPV